MLVITGALLIGAACLTAANADTPTQGQPGPQSPEDSLRALQPRPGFTAELIVAEPLVQSPIAFDWGPDGKLWVVEMRDYPLGLDNKGKPGGRIKYLEDTTGTGKYDKVTLFLDNLEYPTGILAWGKGVLVTCAPEIFYAEDTDGDGKADKKVVLFTGFGEVNPQHRVNGLRWGLDNWVYCANGDFAPVRDRRPAPTEPAGRGTSFSAAEDVRRLVFSGASVRSAKTGTIYDIRNRDIRIRPDEGLLDPTTGQSQFGRDRDDWGDWFGCDHAVPMWHYALEDHYLRRNPHVPAPNPRVDTPPPLTYTVGPVGRDTGTSRSHQGNPFTSSCSVTVYRDDLFGPEFGASWLTSEPVHNLIHREQLVPVGTTFTSRRAPDEQRSEFLASTDTWFSPTTIRTGPDGALWVADIYRRVLEHPNWLPKGWEKRVDVRAGHDRGRIYRVYPKDRQPRPIPRLGRLSTAGLVAALDSPNGWQRDTTQRLLVRQHDLAAVPLLEKAAADSPRALCRLHALCTLDGLVALKPAVVQRALTDAHPGVRRHAVRLCESLLPHAPELGEAMSKLAADPDPKVRMQLAYTLGAWDDPRAGQVLGQLAAHEARDVYLLAAAMSSVNGKNLAAVVQTVLADGQQPPAVALIDDLLRSATGLGETPALVALLDRLAKPANGKYAEWQYAALASWLDALDQRDTPLAKLGQNADAELKAGLARLSAIFTQARAVVTNPHAPWGEQLVALRLLGRGPDGQQEDVATLAALLVPQTPADVQAASVDTLGQLRDPRVADVLLRGWKAYAPGLRAQVLDVLVRREEWLRAVLDALEKKHILAVDVDTPRRKRLLESPSLAARERASKLFGDLVNPDRQKVVEAYKSTLTLKGESSRGVALFAKHCATCHRLGGVGQPVGPDLAQVRDKTPEWLLVAILDPNQAVEAKYLNYMAVTKNGLTFTGVVSNESGNSITLIGTDGKPQVILRNNLEELASTGKSAMPEGLEKDLRPQDLADLIAYLRTGGQKQAAN
jgi:putative membrane-bound dehydrogenase-like protein